MSSNQYLRSMSYQVTLPLCFQQGGILPNYRKNSKCKQKEARLPAETHCFNISILATVHIALWNINLSLRNIICLINNHVIWENFSCVSTGIYFVRSWRLMYLYFKCAKVWNLPGNISYPFLPHTTYSPCRDSLWCFPTVKFSYLLHGTISVLPCLGFHMSRYAKSNPNHLRPPITAFSSFF